jgi:hypothetical protein
MANFCHSCAQPVRPDMRACPNCGTALVGTSAHVPGFQPTAQSTITPDEMAMIASLDGFAAEEKAAVLDDARVFGSQNPQSAVTPQPVMQAVDNTDLTLGGGVRWFGNLGCGIFSGFAVLFFVMNHWFTISGENNWNDADPHWEIFALHIAVAFLGAWFVGRLAYGMMRRALARQDAANSIKTGVAPGYDVKSAMQTKAVRLPPGLFFVFGLMFLGMLLVKAWEAATIFGIAIVVVGLAQARGSKRG